MIKKLSKIELFDKLCDNLTIQDTKEIMLRCLKGEYFALAETDDVISMLYFTNDEDGDYEILNYEKRTNTNI